jgi:hypothetical protein
MSEEITSEQKTEIIKQLWECLSRGYTYEEAQIHMRAFKEGKTTVKTVVVVDEDDIAFKDYLKRRNNG